VRAVAQLAFVIALLSGCGGNDKEQQATVPLFVGLKQSVALQAAEQSGLSVEVRHETNSDIPVGFVYLQSVREGTSVDVGSTVKLSVSRGP
jgi:beta-lactam-binding protein with PASTA domain